MSKAYLFAVMLLAGSIIGCIDAAEDDDELIEVLGIDDAYVTASKFIVDKFNDALYGACLLYTSPSPRDGLLSRMPSSA